MRAAVSGPFHDFFGFDDPAYGWPCRIRFGVDDIYPGTPEAGNNQIAAF
jgi:hypothetical protein